MTHADDLRAWAKGSYTTEAGTELLLQAFGGRYAALAIRGSTPALPLLRVISRARGLISRLSPSTPWPAPAPTTHKSADASPPNAAKAHTPAQQSPWAKEQPKPKRPEQGYQWVPREPRTDPAVRASAWSAKELEQSGMD